MRCRQDLVHIVWVIYDGYSPHASNNDLFTVFERVRGGTMISKMSTFLIFPKIKLDQTVGIAVGHRSGGQLATTLVDCYFHHSFPLFFFSFLVVERNLTSDPVCLFVPNFFLHHRGCH